MDSIQAWASRSCSGSRLPSAWYATQKEKKNIRYRTVYQISFKMWHETNSTLSANKFFCLSTQKCSTTGYFSAGNRKSPRHVSAAPSSVSKSALWRRAHAETEIKNINFSNGRRRRPNRVKTKTAREKKKKTRESENLCLARMGPLRCGWCHPVDRKRCEKKAQQKQKRPEWLVSLCRATIHR